MMAGIVPAARQSAVSIPIRIRLKMTFLAVLMPSSIILNMLLAPYPILNAHRENIKSPASNA